MTRRDQVLVFLAGAATVLGAGPLTLSAPAGAAMAAGERQAAGSWSRAIEVPGLAALDKGGDAGVDEVSCASPGPGNCLAAGFYKDARSHQQGFVAVEKNDRWGKATEVPGLEALNKGGHAEAFSVACAPAGNCAAAGYYKDAHGHRQGFVAVEKNGRWGKATEVPGLGALNKGGHAETFSVACGAAGNCAAGGDYADAHGHQQGFVAVETNGRWGKATEVPGLGALNKGGEAEVGSVACGAAGNCAAGGDYTNGPDTSQGFVATEKNGRWGKAIEVPGLGALNKGQFAEVLSVACGSAGNCVAGGGYADRGDIEQGFVADEKDGHWGKATDVPGLKALDGGNGTEVDSVACASAGNCAAGGTWAYPYTAGFLASEANGAWGKAADAGLPGRIAAVNSVACSSPGNCVAGGSYSNDTGSIDQGWVMIERRGHWGNEIEVPGLGALNKGEEAGVFSVSCAPAGGCTAGGGYTDGHGHGQGFVATEK